MSINFFIAKVKSKGYIIILLNEIIFHNIDYKQKKHHRNNQFDLFHLRSINRGTT